MTLYSDFTIYNFSIIIEIDGDHVMVHYHNGERDKGFSIKQSVMFDRQQWMSMWPSFVILTRFFKLRVQAVVEPSTELDNIPYDFLCCGNIAEFQSPDLGLVEF